MQANKKPAPTPALCKLGLNCKKGPYATWCGPCKRLLAAAPDLLKAAKHIIRDTPEPLESEQIDLSNWQMLRAAIAKAEGR